MLIKNRSPGFSKLCSNASTNLRSKFVIGLQQVIRGLEKGQLGLVLISKDVQPAVLKASLLQMVAGQDCVAACVGGMYAAVKDAWNSLSSMVALGVLVIGKFSLS